MDRIAAIQLFVRVVETGSFSKAARELSLTQPTATKHVASMEKQLKARLLNRNPRAVSLTEAGALYYEKCKDVLRDFEEAESIVAPRQAQVQGLLRIGTSLTFGRQIISPLLVEFMATHPNLRLDVNHDDRYVDLVSIGLDVAIRLGKLSDSSLGGRYLGTNPWVMVAAPRYLAQHDAPRVHTDLIHHNCLIYTSVQGDDFWHMRTPAAERVSVYINGRLRSNSLATLIIAARAGMGITIVPHYAVARAIAAGDLEQIMADHVLPDQEIHAVYPSPKLVPAKVTAVISFLQERLRNQWWLRSSDAPAPAGRAKQR